MTASLANPCTSAPAASSAEGRADPDVPTARVVNALEEDRYDARSSTSSLSIPASSASSHRRHVTAAQIKQAKADEKVLQAKLALADQQAATARLLMELEIETANEAFAAEVYGSGGSSGGSSSEGPRSYSADAVAVPPTVPPTLSLPQPPGEPRPQLPQPGELSTRGTKWYHIGSHSMWQPTSPVDPVSLTPVGLSRNPGLLDTRARKVEPNAVCRCEACNTPMTSEPPCIGCGLLLCQPCHARGICCTCFLTNFR